VEQLRTTLAPLTDWLPPEVRDKLPVEAWWGIFAVAALLGLLLLFTLLRALGRALFGGRRLPAELPQEPVEDLATYPPPPQARGEWDLWVYHLPARLRLVVAAPAGKYADVDATAVERLLDAVLPGLGATAARDRASIRIWPPQLSKEGFAASFIRRTRRPEPDGQPSHWVLVAGKAMAGPQAVLLGLALWTDEPSNLGRVYLEPHQWFDVLRLRDRR
jgi:hypothetical protein